MKYGEIKGFAKPISKIIFGTASPSFLEGNPCDDLLDAVVASGINTIDTARVYGLSEDVIGKWMEKRNNREKIVIETKGGHPSVPSFQSRITRKDIKEDIQRSLTSLRTNYIDIYLLHRDDESVPVEEIMGILNELLSEGKVRVIGVSNWKTERILEANRYAETHHLEPLRVNSPQFSLCEQITDVFGGGCVSLTGKSKEYDRIIFEENQMPIFSYSCLSRGMLSGKIHSKNIDDAKNLFDHFTIDGYLSSNNLKRVLRAEELANQKQATISQIAMSYLFHTRLNTYGIVSMSKARIEENIAALNLPLTEEECAYLNLEK